MNKSIFRTRLQSLILKAIETDRTTLPTVHAFYADGTPMTNEHRSLMCMGNVITSLCSGITTNLKTPGAACTPQSVESLRASFRWAISFIDSTAKFEEFYGEIQSDPDYLDTLYKAFLPMTHTMLAGTIASFGIGVNYTDEEYCREQLENWSHSVCANILAFCAARDINLFD